MMADPTVVQMDDVMAAWKVVKKVAKMADQTVEWKVGN